LHFLAKLEPQVIVSLSLDLNKTKVYFGVI
jgi:hypothetical protein